MSWLQQTYRAVLVWLRLTHHHHSCLPICVGVLEVAASVQGCIGLLAIGVSPPQLPGCADRVCVSLFELAAAAILVLVCLTPHHTTPAPAELPDCATVIVLVCWSWPAAFQEQEHWFALSQAVRHHKLLSQAVLAKFV
jgi:hypothetical protein